MMYEYKETKRKKLLVEELVPAEYFDRNKGKHHLIDDGALNYAIARLRVGNRARLDLAAEYGELWDLIPERYKAYLYTQRYILIRDDRIRAEQEYQEQRRLLSVSNNRQSEGGVLGKLGLATTEPEYQTVTRKRKASVVTQPGSAAHRMQCDDQMSKRHEEEDDQRRRSSNPTCSGYSNGGYTSSSNDSCTGGSDSSTCSGGSD